MMQVSLFAILLCFLVFCLDRSSAGPTAARLNTREPIIEFDVETLTAYGHSLGIRRELEVLEYSFKPLPKGGQEETFAMDNGARYSLPSPGKSRVSAESLEEYGKSLLVGMAGTMTLKSYTWTASREEDVVSSEQFVMNQEGANSDASFEVWKDQHGDVKRAMGVA